MYVRQLYNQVPEAVRACWNQLGLRCRRESQQQTEGFGPSVTHGWATPAKMRTKCYYVQKNFGSICSSLSPSPSHFSHTTNINPFENKVWEVYFYKEVCSFVHWSRHCVWLCFCIDLYYVYVYVQYMYVAIQHNIFFKTTLYIYIYIAITFTFSLERSRNHLIPPSAVSWIVSLLQGWFCLWISHES